MPNKNMKFEEALKDLEKISDQLEMGELDLDESISAFEEGIKLVKLCRHRLDEAEQKIELLQKGESGKIETTTLKTKNAEEIADEQEVQGSLL